MNPAASSAQPPEAASNSLFFSATSLDSSGSVRTRARYREMLFVLTPKCFAASTSPAWSASARIRAAFSRSRVGRAIVFVVLVELHPNPHPLGAAPAPGVRGDRDTLVGVGAVGRHPWALVGHLSLHAAADAGAGETEAHSEADPHGRDGRAVSAPLATRRAYPRLGPPR